MAPTPTMAVNVSLYKSLPYEPLTDFIPLGACSAQTPFVLMVNPSLPVKSVAELVAYAKANPGKLSFASVGPGVPHHLYMEMFKSMTGIEASHVPYRGSLPALNDVVAGPRADDVRRSRSRDRRAASRHGASARHVVAVPRSGLHRHSAARRSRPAGIRCGGLADAGRAGQDAAPDRRPAQSRMTGILAQPDTKEQILKFGFMPAAQPRRSRRCRNYVKSETVALGQGGDATPASRDRSSNGRRSDARSCSDVDAVRSCRARHRFRRATPPRRTIQPAHVTILVPFAPGGGTDLLARAVAQRLEQRLGKPFVIENRTGAGTVVAAGAAAKAAPDGYTLMQATSGTMAMNGAMFKSLPYDPAKDLVPVALVAAVPFVLVVNASVPVHSVAGTGEARQGEAAELRLRRAGAFHHLNAELFSSMTGIKMTHVPYKGSVPA